MPGDVPDGTLLDWPDIAGAYPWDTLLLGNGLSINVWPHFAYTSLFDYAQDRGLTDQDCALFQGGSNFERVLGDLNTTIRVSEVVGVDVTEFYARYRSIQVALGHAIRAVHLTRSQVPDATLGVIRDVMTEFEWIFTTSYDLLIYWAMGYGEQFEPFVDNFRWGGRGRCEFDPERADVYAGQVPVYFLHGALHLVVEGTGVTRKLTRTAVQTLLDQFGQPIEGDPHARPLLVTEGSAHDKVRAIEGNAYLTHAHERLRQRDTPIVVFGSSLSGQDSHLTDSLNEHPERPVAVSMRPAGKRDLAKQQIEIYGRLEVTTLLFFNAQTHPLGNPFLSAALT